MPLATPAQGRRCVSRLGVACQDAGGMYMAHKQFLLNVQVAGVALMNVHARHKEGAWI